MIGFLSSLHWINSDWDGKIGFRTMRRRKKEQSNGKKTPQPDWSGSKLKSNYSRTRQVHICKNVAIVDRVLAFCSHKFGTEFIDDFHVIGRWWYQARTYDQVVIGDQIEYRRFYFLWKDWLQQLDTLCSKDATQSISVNGESDISVGNVIVLRKHDWSAGLTSLVFFHIRSKVRF